MSRSYLDYYESRNIIPVSQSFNNTHRERRLALYKMLSITPLTFNNSNVLEIGPGTGDNARVISELNPRKITLLDGSLPAIEELRRKENKKEFYCPTEIIYSDLYQFKTKDKFDIIICEGCSAQSNPREFYNLIFNIPTNNYAIYSLSTADYFSVLPELLRMHWFALIKDIDSFEDQIKLGVNLFEMDFKCLSSSSRSCSDWVKDNILHPRPLNWSFSIANLLDFIIDSKDNLSYLSSSPIFLTNWDWYKSQLYSSNENNLKAINLWNYLCIYTIDYRIPFELVNDYKTITKEDLNILNKNFLNISKNTTDIYNDLDQKEIVNKISSTIENLKESKMILEKFTQFNKTVKSMNDAISDLKNLKLGKTVREKNEFSYWWGRGQQYISLVNKF